MIKLILGILIALFGTTGYGMISDAETESDKIFYIIVPSLFVLAGIALIISYFEKRHKKKAPHPKRVKVQNKRAYSNSEQPEPQISRSASAASVKEESRSNPSWQRLISLSSEEMERIERHFNTGYSEFLKSNSQNGKEIFQSLCLKYSPEKFDAPSASFIEDLLERYSYKYLDSSINRYDSAETDNSSIHYGYNMGKRQVLAECFSQDSSRSLRTADGEYDFEHFSDHEIEVIVSVIRTAKSCKYASELKGIGLANEAYSIVYKPHYILDEIIIQKYKDSDSPFDLLAVGEAYNNQGARAYREALEYLLRYDREATQEQKDTAQEYLMVAREPSFSIQIALLYEKVGDFQNALAYAMRAMELDESSYHYTYSLVGEIYRKINPEIAIEFYQSLLEDQRYHYFQDQIIEEIGKVQKDIDSGKRYVFNPRGPSVKTRVMAAKITDAAKMFLPGGQYYDLVISDSDWND